MLLAENGVPICHRLHYLQMMTEKLAKGYRTKPGGGPQPNVHSAFVTFVRFARSAPIIRRASGFSRTDQFDAYIRGLVPTAQSIENLAPSAAGNSPNPEYPWSAGGQVIAPVDHPYPLHNLREPAMLKMLNFIEACFRAASEESVGEH